MNTYNGKIKIIKARSRNKRLREIGGTASTVASSREVVAAPSVDLSRYVLKSTFDDLFEKVNLGTDAAPKWAIKAKYNFYTVGWLSFRGANDGSGGSAVAGAANLSDLKDVSLGSLAAGQALVWNGAKWVNSTIATSGLDESSLSNYLSSHSYATQSWVNSQNYVTQQWVAAQDYLTKAKSDALYVTAIGTSGNNLTWTKNGTTNNITVPYATRAAFADAVRDPDHHVVATRRTSANINFDNDCALHYFLATSAMTTSKPGTDGHILHMEWDNSLSWAAQLAVPCDTLGSIQYRFQLGASSWHPWRTVVDANNYQSILANTFYNKTEVDNKLSLKLDKATFDDLFEKVNLGTDAAPKWAIKAKYNFYTVGWLSFRGANDGSGGSAVAGAANLSDLKDVSLGSLAAGQALVWNGAKWVNSTIATSGLDESSLSNYLSSHGYATQAWANGAFVNKAGDTMTGHLTMLAKDVYLKNSTDNSQYVCYGFKNTANAIIAQIGYHNTAKRIIINPVGSSEPWVDAVGKYNLIVGNNELKYNTYTLWHSGNDGHNSGLDADLLDGVHCSDMLHFVTLYPQNLDANGIVTTGSCYVPSGDMNDSSWNGYTFTNFPTSKPEGGFMLMNLAEGNYRRQLYAAYNNPNLYVRYNYFNGTAVTWSPWHTLAFTDSTVANANSLGGKAAAQYVTTDTAQTITGAKTFTNYTKIEQALMFKAGSDGIYFAPSTDGSLRINTHTNYSYTGYIGRISQDGSLAMGSFIKSGGTASQFLMADGSVVTKKTATAPCDLGWVNNDTGNSLVPTIAVLAYWNGCYKGTGSNLQYCDRGRFGTMATASASDYLARSGGSMTNTNVVTNLNADLLDGYHVSQLARLTAANASAGAYNLPVYVNGGVVNAVSSVGEAFLSWGGQSLTGGFSPVDGAMVGALGANRFAFIKPAGTTFQYSTNSGSTWNNYNLSDTQKSGFFDAGVQQMLYASGASNVVGTASHQLRIIIATSAARIYTDINKFVINFSTQGCSGTTVTIEKALESTPDNWVTVASNVPLSGWSGWNVVNVPAFRTYGNVTTTQYGRIRFTFKCKGVSSDKSPFAVLCIMAYGGFGWTTASSMAANGHLYSYDGDQNAYFPACVRLNNGAHDVGTVWNNGVGQIGIALVNNSNQTPLLVAHRHGAGYGVTGANRLFALELLNSGAEMHFAFGGSTKFSMTNTGVFFADGGLWTNGFLSFKGKNTSSDARLKRYIGDIHVPLAVIAKAPNIIYAWRDDGSLDMGSIAQYWQKHLPLSVRLCQNGYLGMDYSKVALACVISMASELLGVKDDVSTLKQEVRQLKRENQQLKQQLNKMERRIA